MIAVFSISGDIRSNFKRFLSVPPNPVQREGSVVREILERMPDADSDELLALFRYLEQRVWEQLTIPEVWESIIAVATALVNAGKLSASEVEAVMDMTKT